MSVPRHPLADERYRRKHSVSRTPAMDAVPKLHPLIIASRGMAVYQHLANGRAFMTYRSERHAQTNLVRARRDVPDAEIIDRRRPTHRVKARRVAFLERLRRRFGR